MQPTSGSFYGEIETFEYNCKQFDVFFRVFSCFSHVHTVVATCELIFPDYEIKISSLVAKIASNIHRNERFSFTLHHLHASMFSTFVVIIFPNQCMMNNRDRCFCVVVLICSSTDWQASCARGAQS